jgi:hypothetical protein
MDTLDKNELMTFLKVFDILEHNKPVQHFNLFTMNTLIIFVLFVIICMLVILMYLQYKNKPIQNPKEENI